MIPDPLEDQYYFQYLQTVSAQPFVKEGMSLAISEKNDLTFEIQTWLIILSWMVWLQYLFVICFVVVNRSIDMLTLKFKLGSVILLWWIWMQYLFLICFVVVNGRQKH
jgi:hypothetical protein